MVVLQHSRLMHTEPSFVQLHKRPAPNPLGGLAMFTLLLRHVEVVFTLQSAAKLFDRFPAPALSDDKTSMSRVPTIELVSITLIIELHADLGHHMVGDVLVLTSAKHGKHSNIQ